MSPLIVNTMLHCFVSPSLPENVRSPAVLDALSVLSNADLIEPVRGEQPGEVAYYIATPRGTAWVKLICSTPYPEMEWVDPRFMANHSIPY